MSPLVHHALSAALVLSFNLLPAANAAVITQYFTFSGAGKNVLVKNSAVATGSISFDTDIYDAGNQLLFNDIQTLTVTVKGATSGNGTFTKADFENIFFSSSTGFDWTQPNLIGQNTWGPGGDGMFSFVSVGGGSGPNAYSMFEMGTNGGFGDQMELTSLTSTAPAPAPVPEPETYMLLAVASAALAYTRRRNNKQQQGTAEPQPSSLLAA